jgi:S-adenosylmethionine hydrolase
MQAKGLNMNIVLLTDFGYQDGFVGVMKGVIKLFSLM